VQSPFRLKPARPARRKARPQWRAPESKPLQLTEPNTVELAARPRAIIASFGMVALLGVGVVAALTIEESSGLKAEAETKSISAPPVATPEPPRIADLKLSNGGEKEIAKLLKEALASQQEPTSETPPDLPSQTSSAPSEPLAPPPELQTVAVAGEPTEVLALNHDDPRWARMMAQNAPEVAVKSDLPDEGVEANAFADSSKAKIIQAAMERTQSPGEQLITAAIPRMAAERPAPLAGDSPEASEPPKAKTLRQARIRTAVNLRAGPADEAKVLGVVPTNAVVSLVGCKSWCEIVFNDRRGWIYKSFIK
jgi:Bacterial SH3 domain